MRVLVACISTCVFTWLPTAVAIPVAATAPVERTVADFAGQRASADAHRVADWVVASGDAAGPFVIVDKKDATLYLFTADGRLRAATPVLLGSAVGDTSVPGIGDRPIAEVRPEERTTPAGRFVGEMGRNARNEDVVWVDYDAAVSMHRVLTTNRAERRLQRLRTATPADNRISYGCINIPRAFYETELRPVYLAHRAIIYVLPEVQALQETFGGMPAD